MGVKQLDNRGSNFYVALYWADELVAKDATWEPLAQALKDNEEQIVKELIECQGPPADVGGYYKVDPAKAEAVMRPSKVFNDLIDKYYLAFFKRHQRAYQATTHLQTCH